MKPTFDSIKYDSRISFQARGNRIAYFAPIAQIITNQEEYDKKQEKDYAEAKEIYDNHINIGAQFIAIGKYANSNIICEIKRINPKSQTLFWKQTNIDEYNLQHNSNHPPAAHKWPIIAMINLTRSKQIKFL